MNERQPDLISTTQRHAGWQLQLIAGCYLAGLLALALYAIIVFWPADPGTSKTFLGVAFEAGSEASWIVLVFVAGVLGGLIHAMRSFYWYVGHRELVKSWFAMYLFLPLVGGALSVVFYILIRGGLLAGNLNGGNNTTDSLSPIGFAAVGILVGLFSEQAILKLKEVADTLFSKPSPGADATPQEEENKQDQQN